MVCMMELPQAERESERESGWSSRSKGIIWLTLTGMGRVPWLRQPYAAKAVYPSKPHKRSHATTSRFSWVLAWTVATIHTHGQISEI